MQAEYLGRSDESVPEAIYVKDVIYAACSRDRAPSASRRLRASGCTVLRSPALVPNMNRQMNIMYGARVMYRAGGPAPGDTVPAFGPRAVIYADTSSMWRLRTARRRPPLCDQESTSRTLRALVRGEESANARHLSGDVTYGSACHGTARGADLYASGVTYVCK